MAEEFQRIMFFGVLPTKELLDETNAFLGGKGDGFYIEESSICLSDFYNFSLDKMIDYAKEKGLFTLHTKYTDSFDWTIYKVYYPSGSKVELQLMCEPDLHYQTVKDVIEFLKLKSVYDLKEKTNEGLKEKKYIDGIESIEELKNDNNPF
jgi:hypothetical protein